VRLPAPVPLFPAATSWTTPLDPTDAIDGPLASDGTRVFLSTAQPEGGHSAIRALDLATGTVLWRVGDRKGALTARPDTLLVRDTAGVVWSVDPASGSARWKSVTGVEGRVPAVFAGDRLLVLGRGISALDAASGKVLWAVTDVTSEVSPAVAADRIYVAAQGGVLRCHSLQDGRLIWARKTDFPSLGVPLAAGDRLYLAAGERAFVSFDSRDGKLRWRWKIGARARFEPVVLGGTVLFVAQEGVLYGLNKNNGHLSLRASLPSRPASGPLLLGSAVLVASHGSRPREALVLTIDGRSGQHLGDLKTVAELATPPLLLGRTLVLGLRDRNAVSALRLGVPDEP
jgi:outer membrane protein assembly factor BamB